MRTKLIKTKEKITQTGRLIRSGRFAELRSQITWTRVIGFFAVFGVIGFFFLTLMVAWITRDLPDPDHLQDRVIVESTKMYDRTGKQLIYELYDQKKRTVVDIATLPRYVVDATISIEDSHFYEHKGIRLQSLARAVFSNVFNLSSGQGGASTLTQQLVKNAIVGDERSGVAGLFRKIREAILAIQIERIYTKDQILKMYFNEIPYGSTNYGIEAASQAYFSKPAKDLTLAEAATLAALPQLPTRYLRNPDQLRGRRDYVLQKMNELGYITEDQMKEAQSQVSDPKPQKSSVIAPHFVLYLKDQLVEEFGEKTVDQGGLKIITTLDYDMQVAANEAVKTGVESAETKYGATNGALLATDPNTGEILAMVGSHDYNDDENGGKYNVVTQSVRQPGSSFKPVVYAAAFEKGFPPETVVYDVETDFPYDDKTYHPQNYDGKERGPITLRSALQGSLNIPAVKAIFLVGIDGAFDFAERLGYTTFSDRSKFGPSVVLGGGGVRMTEHVRAYGAFANGGIVRDLIGVLKVEDRNGKDITPKKRVESKQVISPELAATVSNVLSDNAARQYVFGAGSRNLVLSDRPVAAKTGTTNDYHDAWTVGYTPNVVAAVWVGNNNNAKMKSGADGSVVAAPIWHQFMVAASKKLPAAQFPTPPENTATNFMLRGLSNGGVTVEIDTVSGKLATEHTPKETREKRTFIPAHDILYYVDSENPLGPSPENPSAHPQFNAWETAVQRWVTNNSKEGVVFGAPPTEFDDVHGPQFAPTVSISGLSDGTAVGSTFIVNVDASAPRGIARVEFRLDGNLVGMATSYPYALSVNLGGASSGEHVVKVTAVDDVGNMASDEVRVQYILP